MRKPNKTSRAQYSLITNRAYGLYVGFIVAQKPQPDGSLHVRVRDCRHVARWFGKTGGITSLVVHGLCGPRAAESRIGAAVPGISTLTGVVNIYPLTPEARATIETAVQS